MPSTEKIHIIGIGDDGLAGVTDAARRLIADADLLVGSSDTLALMPKGRAERLAVEGSFDEALQRISKTPSQRVVVLASGDPLFYGVARYLCDKLGKDRFEVLPHVSSMQLAFARVKESWEEAYLTNLSRIAPLASILDKIRIAEKVGLFTSEESPPARLPRRCWISESIISRAMSARTSARPTSA